uniref:Wbp11/ELF5/Saf1 N-terminal domain-containing protein n=1 Tax=Kalanchoe fedtschenkoi TaxID=63787 RepID=A0A7N1A493_KALFE
MKTTKGGKVMNPTDAYRKEQRKKELKRNKKERKKVREVGILKKDPESLREQIEKLEMMKADGALDKARKHKKRQLEDTLNLVLKKRKEYEEKLKEKGEAPVMFSHLGPPKRLTTAEEEEERMKHPKPEDSVYYHPTLNPTGAPPPGKPPMFKSSIGPRIPLSGASAGEASTSNAETDDLALAIPPPPPPPPLPLPNTSDMEPGAGAVIPASLPLTPPPPPPRPPMPEMGNKLPPPPPPPGSMLKEQSGVSPSLPLVQPPPPGTALNDQAVKPDVPTAAVPNQVASMAPPPPPPGLPVKSNPSEGALSELSANDMPGSKDISKMVPPPPPQRPQLIPGPPMIPNVHPDMLPPGMGHFPPPPPPPMMLPGQILPPGMVMPLMHRPPFGPPPGLPPMMRPPLPPGPPPPLQDDDHDMMRVPVPQKPSYIKSAASTVVKRPLAQHTPELTSMIPASVRVRRETATPKPKPKTAAAAAAGTTKVIHSVGPSIAKPTAGPSTAPKSGSIDDSYTAFLEDMKALGALDS